MASFALGRRRRICLLRLILSVFIIKSELNPEDEAGSSLVAPVVVDTGSQRKGLKSLSSNKDDVYKALLQKETERSEAQLRLAEEQLTLTKLQQARLEIRLLRATLVSPHQKSEIIVEYLTLSLFFFIQYIYV